MKTLNRLVFVFLSILLFSACDKSNVENNIDWTNKVDELYAHNSNKIAVTEGYAGTLTHRDGNCMPVVDYFFCKEFPISRKIFIYEATKNSQTEFYSTRFTKVNTALIATITTDSEGFFQVSIPAGKYSVFIENEGVLYANFWDNESCINPIVVENNRVTIRNQVFDTAVY